MSEKLSAKQYAEQLLYKPEYAADKQPDVKEKAAAFAEGYKNFLDHAKTEREAAATSEQMLLAAGYKPFEPKKTYAPGEKIYFIQEHKAVVAATIGQKPFEEGFRLVIAHIDSPRLDLRPNPLYESDHLSYFKTHYYGGIRKYQWVTIPMELHGVVALTDGTTVTVNIGGDEGDPKLVITDSQAFQAVNRDTPEDILLTSFSILFARYKGNLAEAVRGAAMLDKLQNGDSVLISEGCTHHRQCGDIGTEKLPNWLKQYTGCDLNYHFTSGREFPQDLSPYALVIHCGGCMLNEREMQSRIRHSLDCHVPITNYGIAIAQMHGILARSLGPFPHLAALLTP